MCKDHCTAFRAHYCGNKIPCPIHIKLSSRSIYEKTKDYFVKHWEPLIQSIDRIIETISQESEENSQTQTEDNEIFTSTSSNPSSHPIPLPEIQIPYIPPVQVPNTENPQTQHQTHQEQPQASLFHKTLEKFENDYFEHQSQKPNTENPPPSPYIHPSKIVDPRSTFIHDVTPPEFVWNTDDILMALDRYKKDALITSRLHQLHRIKCFYDIYYENEVMRTMYYYELQNVFDLIKRTIFPAHILAAEKEVDFISTKIPLSPHLKSQISKFSTKKAPTSPSGISTKPFHPKSPQQYFHQQHQNQPQQYTSTQKTSKLFHILYSQT